MGCKKNGDEIENLFKKSAEEALFIQITLKNDKVYIGYSETIPIPQKWNSELFSAAGITQHKK